MNEDAAAPGPPERPRLPRSVWALGLVSLFMDVSSEMIHSLLPVFLVTGLGASAMTVGMIEGIGEATASISKLFSGWLSDRLGRRKTLTVIGYGLSTLSKPLFALAQSASFVLAARFSDRVGKGIRGAPRDALIGDITPPDVRGSAYGLRQSLDTIGAFAGPLLAMALMALSSDNFRFVFWFSALPAVIAVVILVAGVREPERTRPSVDKAAPPLRWAGVDRLGILYWGIVAVSVVLTLARFSEAFLILRAENAGLPLALVPMVLVVMNVVYAATSYPMGVLSDRGHRWSILRAGFAVLILADLVLAFAPGIWTVMLGIGLWGLQMGMTQGLLSALVADSAPEDLRGTAFGIFNLATGVAILFASLVAGGLWEFVGPSATFIAGGALTAVGLLGTVVVAARTT